MPGLPWVKLWTEMLDDVKLAELDDAQKWRFVQLILLAGECDAGGALVTGDSRMTHKQIAWRLRSDINVIEKDIALLTKLSLIIDDGTVQITKFRDRQGPTQAEKREKWAERQRKHRERANVTGDSRVTHADVTPVEEEEEEEEDKDKEEEQEPKPPRTTQPAPIKTPVDGGGVIFKTYEQNIGSLTPLISQSLEDLLETFSEDWVLDAMTIAAANNTRKLAYITGILNNWKLNGKDSKPGAKKTNEDDYKKYQADAQKWGYET